MMQDLNTNILNEIGLSLQEDDNGLYLTDGELELRADFSRLIPRLKQSNLEKEMLVKAARIKGMDHKGIVIDATAGLGEDSFLLAAAGHEIKLFEYNPIINLLLRDAIKRALNDPLLAYAAERMEVVGYDSITEMKALEEKADIVYLDPMFPGRQKSGLIKKKFQLLQKLEKPCTDEDALLSVAKTVKPLRIIIKRPLKGPYLGDIKPDFSYEGKSIRYDCLININ